MSYRIEVLKQKGKLILTSPTELKIYEAKSIIKREGHNFIDLNYQDGRVFIFTTSDDLRAKYDPSKEVEVEDTSIYEDVKITNLIESYGASELPPAPEEVTDPEPSAEQEEKTTTRRRRNTRRKTTKTTETSE